MNDTNFDQLIRASLDWESRRVSARQPTLRTAAQRLAERLGPTSRGVRPRMALAPTAVGGLNTIGLILLLLALAAAAVVVGALVLRTAPVDLRPGPFGYATECRVGLREGVVFELGTERIGTGGNDRNLTLWRDGSYQTNSFASSAPTRAGMVRNSTVTQRLLAPAGVERLRDRITGAGLTPGCRSLTTASMGGRISALTDAGYVEVFWGPNVTSRPVAKVMTAEQRAELARLVDDLEDPTTWLPADAIVEPEIHRVKPDRWLVWIGARPTENGEIQSGVDPRYEQVELPGGVGLLEFGTDVPVIRPELQDVAVQRCGELDTDDALALAQSLDSLDLGTDRGGDLYNSDSSLEINVSIEPVYPALNDCSAAAATMARVYASPQPAATPSGEFAAVDPCSLVPDGTAERIFGTSHRAVWPSRLPLGLAANACVLTDSPTTADDPFADPYYGVTMLTVYPRAVDREGAGEIARLLFGEEPSSDEIHGHPVWMNHCFGPRSACPSGVVAWTGRQLMAFEFTDSAERAPNVDDPLVPRLTDDMKRAFVEAVLIGIRAN